MKYVYDAESVVGLLAGLTAIAVLVKLVFFPRSRKDAETVTVQVSRKDGQPFTPEQKASVEQVISELIDRQSANWTTGTTLPGSRG